MSNLRRDFKINYATNGTPVFKLKALGCLQEKGRIILVLQIMELLDAVIPPIFTILTSSVGAN